MALENQIPGLDNVPYPGQAPAAGGSGLDMMALLRMMFGGGQNNGTNMAELLKIIHPPDVQGERNRGYMPGVDNEYSPFSNGFFGAKPGTPAFSGRTTPLDMSAAAKAPALGNQWDGGAGAFAASPMSFMPQQNSAPLGLPPIPRDPNEDEMQQMLKQNRAFTRNPTGFRWSQVGRR